MPRGTSSQVSGTNMSRRDRASVKGETGRGGAIASDQRPWRYDVTINAGEFYLVVGPHSLQRGRDHQPSHHRYD